MLISLHETCQYFIFQLEQEFAMMFSKCASQNMMKSWDTTYDPAILKLDKTSREKTVMSLLETTDGKYYVSLKYFIDGNHIGANNNITGCLLCIELLFQ